MRRLSVDRFDGSYCICQDLEDLKMYALPLAEVPKGTREGDVLTVDDQGELSLNGQETQSRKNDLGAKQDRLFR